MEAGGAIVDQRVIADRRQFSWRTIFFGFIRSRRHNLRRGEDADVVFLDWHHPWLFFLAVGTMIFSFLDAFMTLQLLERGFYEANPLMAAVMSQGTTLFAATKLAMTGTSILILVFLAKSRFLNRVRTGLILTTFFSLYACLVCYQFVYLMSGL